MEKKEGLNSSSWRFFKKLKTKRIKKQLLLCFALIFLLNSKMLSFVLEGLRFAITSVKVYFHYALESTQNVLDKVCYVVSSDANDALLNLRKENIKLKSELDGMSHLKSENDELRKLLSVKDAPNYSVVAAKIVSIFSNDYIRSCILDIGSAEGVFNDDVVMTNDGLVGRISEINERWSRVLLITDMNSNVPVRIGDTQVNAIVTGDNSSFLRISMKHEDVDIKEGDIVETSGFCSVFCDKIPVGKVVKRNDAFLVMPFVDFNSINFVSILRKSK